MSLRSIPWSKPMEESPTADSDSATDLAQFLKEHVRQGLSPDLALDLALNEIAVRAAEATRASSAALGLVRNAAMVCRAATGDYAPDVGVPLNTESGLSGACLRTRKPQFSADTQSDSRIDAAASRRLGIRSMLAVPVLEKDAAVGILEVFSNRPAAFLQSDQTALEGLARESAALLRLAIELREQGPRPAMQPVLVENASGSGSASSEVTRRESPPGEPGEKLNDGTMRAAATGQATAPETSPHEKQNSVAVVAPQKRRVRESADIPVLLLGGLVIIAAIALSLMVGSRTGWFFSRPAPGRVGLQTAETAAPAENPPAALSPPSQQNRGTNAASVRGATGRSPASSSAGSSNSPAPDGKGSGGMVVYDRGRVVFRMQPTAPGSTGTSRRETGKTDSGRAAGESRYVWLAADRAESLLQQRVEPDYPEAARAANRSGDVAMEVFVGTDGSVTSVRTISGDPLLAGAAETAVRAWRYQPYVLRGEKIGFLTDVTLRFSLPQ